MIIIESIHFKLFTNTISFKKGYAPILLQISNSYHIIDIHHFNCKDRKFEYLVILYVVYKASFAHYMFEKT